MDKFSELKAAAMAATPGPWILDDDSWSEGDNANVSTEERYDGRIVSIAQIEGGGSESGFDEPFSTEQQANARYITAANPAAILAMLAELEAKDKRIAELSRLLAHNIERAEKAEKRLVYSKDAITTWERKAISNFDECATMSQRIIELEAIRSDASQVFKEIGNELGCNPDNESIMMAIDELKAQVKVWESAATKHLARAEEAEKRLATPVVINLPERRDDSYDRDGVSSSEAFNTCRSICGLMFRQQLRAAGFTVGDE